MQLAVELCREGVRVHSKEVYEEEGEGGTPSLFTQRRKLIPQHAHPLLSLVNPVR